MTQGVEIAAQRSTAVKAIAGMLNEANPVIGVLDFNILDLLIAELYAAYPEEWVTHTVAIRTNQLPGVLEHFRARGFGVETTSAAELEIATRSGFSPANIDHHAATAARGLLRQLIESDVSLSIDNLSQLLRFDELIDDSDALAASIGLRIAAQASRHDGEAAPATASHRGIGLRDNRRNLIEVFTTRPWLNQLTVHPDAGTTTLQHGAEQLADVHALAEDIEHAAGAQRVHRIQIGGQLPVNYASDEVVPTAANHRFVHQAMMPELFDGKYQIVTEFSQALTAKAGMILARVEYTHPAGETIIAFIHANLPGPATDPMPPVRIEAYDAEGVKKDDAALYYYDVVGPSGLLGRRIQLPELAEGDVLAVLDVGARAFGTNAAFTAPIYSIRADGLLAETSLLHPGQSAHHVADAAGTYQPHKLLH